MSRVLDVSDVSVHFGGLVAVDGAGFHVDEGEIVGLIGPNGAGKTTLFNVISGAQKPTGGTVRLLGEDVTAMRPDRICHRGLARTFQSSKLFSSMTAAENLRLAVVFGQRDAVSGASAVADETARILDLIDMSDDALTHAGDLSLARQRRLEIGRALATGARLLLLDEALAGLTPKELEQAVELLRRLKDSGITVLMIEHVMHIIMEICDRLVVLHFGNTIVEGPTAEVAADPQVRAVYLGDR